MVKVEVEGQEYIIAVPGARNPLSVFGMRTDNPMIVGISPWVPYTKELFDKIMYKVNEYHDNKEELFWKIQSSKNSNAFYTVRRKDNKFMCTCLGFKYHNHCKHIDAVQHDIRFSIP